MHVELRNNNNNKTCYCYYHDNNYLFPMSGLRGQTYMSSLHCFLWWARHQHIKGTDGSCYHSIHEPTKPSQPIMSDDVSDEDGPQHWELHLLL